MLRMLNAQPGHFRLDSKVEQLIAMSGVVWLGKPLAAARDRRSKAA
jgi:hypothetical protein